MEFKCEGCWLCLSPPMGLQWHTAQQKAQENEEALHNCIATCIRGLKVISVINVSGSSDCTVFFFHEKKKK